MKRAKSVKTGSKLTKKLRTFLWQKSTSAVSPILYYQNYWSIKSIPKLCTNFKSFRNKCFLEIWSLLFLANTRYAVLAVLYIEFLKRGKNFHRVLHGFSKNKFQLLFSECKHTDFCSTNSKSILFHQNLWSIKGIPWFLYEFQKFLQ